MADEPKKDHPEDIESILSDLDAILTDMGGDAQAAAPAATPAATPPVPPPAPKPAPKVDLPAPVPPPVPAPAPAPVPAPKAVEPPKQGIELAPREGMITPPPPKPPEPPKPAPKLPEQRSIELTAGPSIPPPPAPPPPPKPVEPPKPAEPVKAAELPKPPPAPTAVPVPAPVVASTKIEELPPEAPKEQIRRVAYIFTSMSSEVKTSFSTFLSQAARTISKKPLYLREVLAHEVSSASDPNALVQKALQVKASAILAVVEGWPSSKVEELSEACSRANMLFRAIATGDALKKSTAVDIIVDMMLLPGEG